MTGGISSGAALRRLVLLGGLLVAGLALAMARLGGRTRLPEVIVAWCGAAIARIAPMPDPRYWSAAWLMVAMAAAAIGAAAITLWRTRAYVRKAGGRMAKSTPPRLAAAAARLGMSHQIDAIDAEAPVCFCHGLLRPRVAISTGMLELLEEEALLAVLAHERHHARRRDPLMLALANVLAALAFPLPLARALHRAHRTARELEADRAAIEAVGRRSLAAALLALAHPMREARTSRRGSESVATAGAAVPGFGERSMSAARLDQLAGPSGEGPSPSRSWRSEAWTSAFTASTLLAFLMTGSPASGAALQPSSAARGDAMAAPAHFSAATTWRAMGEAGFSSRRAHHGSQSERGLPTDPEPASVTAEVCDAMHAVHVTHGGMACARLCCGSGAHGANACPRIAAEESQACAASAAPADLDPALDPRAATVRPGAAASSPGKVGRTGAAGEVGCQGGHVGHG